MKCGSVAHTICNSYCQTSNQQLDAACINCYLDKDWKWEKKTNENKINHPIKIVHEDFGLDIYILLWQGIEILSILDITAKVWTNLFLDGGEARGEKSFYFSYGSTSIKSIRL